MNILSIDVNRHRELMGNSFQRPTKNRNCLKCGKSFLPFNKGTHTCDVCKLENYHIGRLAESY